MTKKELIEELEKYPDDIIICGFDFENTHSSYRETTHVWFYENLQYDDKDEQIKTGDILVL